MVKGLIPDPFILNISLTYRIWTESVVPKITCNTFFFIRRKTLSLSWFNVLTITIYFSIFIIYIYYIIYIFIYF